MTSPISKKPRGVLRAAICSTVVAELLLPTFCMAASSDAKARGADIFSKTGCVHCHGAAGISGGRGPSLLDVRKRRKPDQIFSQIHDGGKSMPAFGDQLSSDDINDLVHYLRSKRKPPTQTP